MKLYIKQKGFSCADRFTVKDENGEDRYYAEGGLLSWGKKLYLCDISGAEAAFIKQKLLTFLSRYFAYINGELAAQVKEISLFRPRRRQRLHAACLSAARARVYIYRE